MIEMAFEARTIGEKRVFIVRLRGELPAGTTGNVAIGEMRKRLDRFLSRSESLPDAFIFDFTSLTYYGGDALGSLWLDVIGKGVNVRCVASDQNREAINGLNEMFGCRFQFPIFDRLEDALANI
ncbi:MAG: hypothetical protein N3A38_12770 [Planctomycetota bacterium]|nr:hypothetical protein [Planctomycetota bacterium]